MSGETILIVDDDVFPDASAMAEIVSGAKYQVVGIADSEASAIAMAIQFQPHIVLMDIKLQGEPLAGIHAAREISRLTQSQVIFVSGQTGIHDAPYNNPNEKLLSEVSRTRYPLVTKPVEPRQLLSTIRLTVLNCMNAKGGKIVFLSYNRKDDQFATELERHMEPLKDAGIRLWRDSHIDYGGVWDETIVQTIAVARAAICLISIDWINSKYIKEYEWPKLLDAARRGVPVIPVFVGWVDEPTLRDRGVLQFNGVNRPNDPISDWLPETKRARECWGRLSQQLRDILN